MWCTYRASNDGDGAPTSDAGWGCAVRSAQSLCATALLRVVGDSPHARQRVAGLVVDWPHDGCALSLPHLVKARGAGKWYGPHEISHVLASLTHQRELRLSGLSDKAQLECLRVVAASDGAVARSDVAAAAATPWGNAVLLLVPLRLGLSHRVEEHYRPLLARAMSLPSFAGAIGGPPRSSQFLVGPVDDRGLLPYLDTHVVKSAPLMPTDVASLPPDQPVQAAVPDSFVRSLQPPPQLPRMHMADLDSSIALGFLLQSQCEFDAFCDQAGALVEHPACDENGRAVGLPLRLFSLVDRPLGEALLGDSGVDLCEDEMAGTEAVSTSSIAGGDSVSAGLGGHDARLLGLPPQAEGLCLQRPFHGLDRPTPPLGAHAGHRATTSEGSDFSLVRPSPDFDGGDRAAACPDDDDTATSVSPPSSAPGSPFGLVGGDGSATPQVTEVQLGARTAAAPSDEAFCLGQPAHPPAAVQQQASRGAGGFVVSPSYGTGTSGRIFSGLALSPPAATGVDMDLPGAAGSAHTRYPVNHFVSSDEDGRQDDYHICESLMIGHGAGTLLARRSQSDEEAAQQALAPLDEDDGAASLDGGGDDSLGGATGSTRSTASTLPPMPPISWREQILSGLHKLTDSQSLKGLPKLPQTQVNPRHMSQSAVPVSKRRWPGRGGGYHASSLHMASSAGPKPASSSAGPLQSAPGTTGRNVPAPVPDGECRGGAPQSEGVHAASGRDLPSFAPLSRDGPSSHTVAQSALRVPAPVMRRSHSESVGGPASSTPSAGAVGSLIPRGRLFSRGIASSAESGGVQIPDWLQVGMRSIASRAHLFACDAREAWDRAVAEPVQRLSGQLADSLAGDTGRAHSAMAADDSGWQVVDLPARGRRSRVRSRGSSGASGGSPALDASEFLASNLSGGRLRPPGIGASSAAAGIGYNPSAAGEGLGIGACPTRIPLLPAPLR